IGDWDLRGRVVRIADSSVDMTSTNVKGGTLSLTASDYIDLDNATLTSTTQTGLGGDIELNAGNAIVLRNGTQVLAEASGTGTGGAIRIDPPAVFPDLARLSPSVLQSAEFVAGVSGARISADSGAGTAGTVETNAPELDLEHRLAPLDTSLLAPHAITSVC